MSSNINYPPNTKIKMDAHTQRAIDIATKAVSQDEQGHKSQAFALYQQAIALFLEAIKKETPGNANHLKKTVENYLSRAEEIKMAMEKEAAQEAEAEAQAAAKKAHAPASKKSVFSSAFGVVKRGGAGGGGGAGGAGSSRKPTKPDDYDYTGGRRAPPTSSSTRGGRTAVAGRGGAAGRSVGGSAAGSSSSATTHHRGASSSSSSSAPANELEQLVMQEMMDKTPNVKWDQIAGLNEAKQILQEVVVLPNLRPDLFKGLRSPPKGVLLYGPPGTGKTLLAKAVASESGFAFFSISASSLVSKFLGEGEKMVRALFSVARKNMPCVIFVDEIDSMLSIRKENEHEASRRLKTEFLVNMDGATTDTEERILVVGATNIPWELDEAVLRRLSKKVYIPLPDVVTREALVKNLLQSQKHNLKAADLSRVVDSTEGYSCSDISQLCKEAAMMPIRECPDILRVKEEKLRPLSLDDFAKALRTIRPSVSPENVQHFTKWLREKGYT